MKKVCVISTLNHNVGDDFVRTGILSLLREVLGDLETRIVHKHFPATVRSAAWGRFDERTRWLSDRLSWRARLSLLAEALPPDPRADLLLSSDILVQSGAPVYWKNQHSKCSQAEWFTPLIERRWQTIRERVPLLNLAAGSCQALGSDGTEISEDVECRDYIDRFTRWSTLTTVRDALARKIVLQCGHDVPLLPCPSIFAPEAVNLPAREPAYVALNYMPHAGHYDLAGEGPQQALRWEVAFSAAARRLAGRQPCLMICHDRKELAEAARLLPEVPRFFSTSWQDYLDAYSRCRFAIVNRVHGAVVSAAMGKPVLLTGNDTRLLTAAEVPGIRIMPVSDAGRDFEGLVEEMHNLHPVPVPAAFIQKTRENYLNLLRSALLS